MKLSNHPSSDVWEQLGWVWSVIFYISLVVPLVVVFLDREVSQINLRWMTVLAVLSGIWHWLGMIQLPKQVPDLRQRPFLPLVYFFITIALWYGLVSIHPIFFFLLFGLYGQIYACLPIQWGIPVSALLTALAAYKSGTQLSWSNELLWIFFLVTPVGALAALWIKAVILQSAQRRILIQQLEQTQASLVAAERQAGVLQERQRLAHEIHDTLAQGFISIVMHLEAAEQALETAPHKAHHHLSEAKHTARESVAQARRVVQDLRPIPLEDSPLPEAIQQVVGQWSAGCGILGTATITGDIRPLHPDVEVTLLRATQEALANVRKHAQASQVAVTLSYMEDVVMLDVQDDGAGLNGRTAVSQAQGGFGLKAMQERVKQVGGSLLLESSPGEGTTLVVKLPANDSPESTNV